MFDCAVLGIGCFLLYSHVYFRRLTDAIDEHTERWEDPMTKINEQKKRNKEHEHPRRYPIRRK